MESVDESQQPLTSETEPKYDHAEFIVVLKVYAIEDDPENNPWTDEEMATALFDGPLQLINSKWGFDANLINLARAD